MKWSDIQEFDGDYQVSSTGIIRSRNRTRKITDSLGRTYTKTIKGKTLKTRILQGYEVVGLSKNGTCYTRRVHRLMAQGFLPNPDNKSEVNHINGNKTDNRIENLEWCTPKENTQHAWDTGLATTHSNHNPTPGEKNGKAVLSEPEVRSIHALYNNNTSTTYADLSERFGVSVSTIGKIINGKRWSHVYKTF